MKIKLSELIEDEAERMFIAQFCKEADEYVEKHCDIFDLCCFIKKALNDEDAESFSISFDINEEDNCWIDIYSVLCFTTKINNNELLKKYIFKDKENSKMDFIERNRYERSAEANFTTLLKNVLTLFLSIDRINDYHINFLSDLFDYKEEAEQ